MAIGLEIRIKRLEAKVQELNEREAIRDLRYRYHEYVNEGKFTRIAGLFTVNGELAFGLLGHAKGRAQISAFFRGLGPESSRAAQPSRPRLTRVRQFIHNHMIEIDGDRASGFAYLEAKPVYNGESYVVAARYDDEYVKQNGKWKFKKMSLKPFFMVPLKEGWAGDDLLKMGR